MDVIERPKSLTELVTETMRDWIVSGRLELGSHLSEARLAKQLKVSRTPDKGAIAHILRTIAWVCPPPTRTKSFSIGCGACCIRGLSL